MPQFQNIDLDFLKKFDKPGPRYTSYPTAPLFSDLFTADDFKNEIIRTNALDKSNDLSLYLHFPFCDTLCYFCGCTMLVTHDRNKISGYNQYLKKEIEMITPFISYKRKVTQLHWGGGTPSYLTPAQIRDIGFYVKERYNFADDIEASVEIDPRDLTRDHIKAFSESGFNRMSMGVQDFNEKVQKAVNRIQSEKITRDAVNWGRELGFKSINLDLIYGLPFQTYDSFSDTLDKAIDISPERFAIFNYAHVPWLKKHQNVMPEEELPTPEQKLRILKMTIEKLTDAGYWYIGMDHFAKPDDELAVVQKNKTLYRNFQGYSTRAGSDVYAFGMSSISQFDNIYAQNVKELNNYYSRLDADELATHLGYVMTEDDHIRKYTIMNLMCHLEIDKQNIENKFHINFDEYFSESIQKLKPFVDEGFVSIDKDKITVIELGKLIIRNLAMCFDAYIDKMSKDKPIFSRTV
jgi:oxygen-independent coproporphyrinogen III oxidase